MMSKRMNCIVTLLFLICGLTVFSVSTVFADFSISVTPLTGGSKLDFGQIDNPSARTQELRIRINNSDTTQYQVFQYISEPFVNERGDSIMDLILKNAVGQVNMSGTLYSQNVQTVDYSPKLLYTSGANGASDSFTLIYDIDERKVNRTGRFRSQLVFTVQPVASSASQRTAVINMFFDASGNLDISTETSSGGMTIDLDSDLPFQDQGSLTFKISGNGNNRLDIYQEMLNPVMTPAGFVMQDEAVLQTIVDSGVGTNYLVGNQALSPVRKRIYSTASDQDRVVLQFLLDAEIHNQRAGRYTGSVKYFIEVNGVIERIFDLNLKAHVKPVLKMDLSYPLGDMKMENILPTSDAQIREVQIDVKSNTGQRYMINQKIDNRMTNKDGDEYPEDLFQYRLIGNEDDLGTNRIEIFKPVPTGTSPIYISDNVGSPTSLTVQYRIEPQFQLKPGDYKSRVMFSLDPI